MKIVKNIKYGDAVDVNNMQHILGGQEDNINEADYCKCSADTNQSWWCSNNTNKYKYCSC